MPSVNPSARDNYAIRLASENSHSKIVELLANKISLSKSPDLIILDLIIKMF